MDKLSLLDIKKKNYTDIYHFIYKNSNSSKQAIAQGLNMSLPTVSQHLNTLLENGLIQHCGQLQSQIGRKAAAYSIVPDARIAIGVEIIRKRVTIAAVNLYGKLITYRRANILFENSGAYYEQVCSKILEFIEEQSFSPQQILGISFAMQGLVTSDNKKMAYSKILDTTNLTAEFLENYLHYPCMLRHDSECAAATALWHNPEIDNAIYLSISNHLGGAVIIRGEIQQGRAGKSGTMEHMTLYPKGKKCYCGQLGCAECYCSANAFLKEDEDLETFFKNKKTGDTDCLERWHLFLDHLSLFLNNIHLVIDSVIILGGHISPFMEDEDFAYLHKQIMENTAFPEAEPFVLPGSRLPHEIPIGAAMKYIKEFLDQI